MTNNEYSHRIVYKNYVINIEKTTHESHNDFEMRKWYILKNIHLSNEYVTKDTIALCSLEELVNFSKLHVKKNIYNFGDFHPQSKHTKWGARSMRICMSNGIIIWKMIGK